MVIASRPKRSTFAQRPSTRLGWWAFGLMAAFLVMWIINTLVFMPGLAPEGWNMVILPIFGILMVLCGLSGGIVGLIALIRNRERSWMVWLCLLPGAFVLFLLLGEFLVPH
jgi:hypothetical protein